MLVDTPVPLCQFCFERRPPAALPFGQSFKPDAIPKTGTTVLKLGGKTCSSGADFAIFYERTGNVYENKGPARKSTTLDPSLSKEGNSGHPSSDEEGLGVVGSARGLRAESGLLKADFLRTNRECL